MMIKRKAERPMHDEPEPGQLTAKKRSQAGHPEILGETYAKFEFFENGWNPYSRFLDVDKVDLILRSRRRSKTGQRIYREIQVKFGKLYPVGSAWERELFDFTSWRFFKEEEFAGLLDQKDFFIAYVLSRYPDSYNPKYQGDIFIFPIRDFDNIIRNGISSKGQRKVYISRLKGKQERWVLRRANRFSEITEETCLDVTVYRRNFAALLTEASEPIL
jgi:hypothetical protein